MYIVWLNFHKINTLYQVKLHVQYLASFFFLLSLFINHIHLTFSFFNLETETPVNEGNKEDSSQNEHISSAVSSKQLFPMQLIGWLID